MQPAIPAGALVYTEQVQAGQLKQGDVITFRQGSGAVVTHRIVSIDEEGNITTKGDANNVEDQATITAAQVIGRVKFHLPVLGALCEWFKTRTGILTVTGVLIVLILSVFLPEIFSHNGRSAGRKKD
jgi:signal peptidase